MTLPIHASYRPRFVTSIGMLRMLGWILTIGFGLVLAMSTTIAWTRILFIFYFKIDGQNKWRQLYKTPARPFETRRLDMNAYYVDVYFLYDKCVDKLCK